MSLLAPSSVLLSCAFIWLGLLVESQLGEMQQPVGPMPPPMLQVSPQQRAQLEEMQQNWTKLRRRMCSMPNSDAVKLYNQMEVCNKINHVYRIQV